MSDKVTRQLQYNSLKANSSMIWLLFLLLGWSYGSLGSMTKQIFFYLTLGGCGIWALCVLFTLNNKIKNYNKEIGLSLGMPTEELVANKLI